MFQIFTKNTQGNDYVLGDVHGMWELVEQLMDVVKFDPSKDRMFACGDLVDRGPRSKEVANWLKQPWFHSVIGNHEQMALEVFAGMTDLTGWDSPVQQIAIHMMNGGAWFHELSGDQQAKACAAMGKMPLAIEVITDKGRVGIVHAEVPNDDWNYFANALINERPANFEHIEHYALWSRNIIKKFNMAGVEGSGVDNIDMVIVGHSPCKEVVSVANIMYLDTGAAFGRKQSMVCIQGPNEGNIYEADSEYKWRRE